MVELRQIPGIVGYTTERNSVPLIAEVLRLARECERLRS